MKIKAISIRYWFILSLVMCLFLPKVLFELVDWLQKVIFPTLDYSGKEWIFWPLLYAVIGWGSTVLGLGWLINRSVVKPLTAMQQAAQQIITGDINFTIPASRVSEMNEVTAAFETMRKGLQEAIYRQAALEQERRLLISAIAHDLRTPLFSLRGYLDGLGHGVAKTPEKIDHYLEVCQQQADVPDRRIQILFDYTKLEYLEQPLQQESVDWNALVQETADRLRPAAEAKQIDIQTTHADTAHMLDGDPQLLTRMLENLLDNAIRHTPSGGTVELDWQVASDRLSFTVTDTGPGIAAEDLSYIFLPMYRGDQARSTHSGGGLGLTIAQRIVQAHGGILSAGNRPTGGAKITGWLALPPAYA